MIERQSKKYSVLRDWMHGSSGFTLTELMVVVAIISILAVIGIPSYLNALPHMRLKSAAGGISGALQYARLNAISNNAYYKVKFNYTSNTFTIYKKKAGGTWKEVPTSANSDDWVDIDLGDPSSGGIINVPKVEDSAGDTSFVYRPDGMVDMKTGDNVQAVYLKNIRTPKNGYENYRVKVTKNGTVNVQVYNGEDWVRG